MMVAKHLRLFCATASSAFVVLAAFLTIGSAQAEAQCSGCAPPSLSSAGGFDGGSHTICFERTTEDESGDLDEGVADAMADGMQDYWGDNFDGNFPVTRNKVWSGGYCTLCSAGRVTWWCGSIQICRQALRLHPTIGIKVP